MSMKDSFSAEEWMTLHRAPISAALAVVTADPGGLLGAVKEGGALAASMRDAVKVGAPGLVHDLISDLKENKLKPGDLGIPKAKSKEEAQTNALAALTAAAELVDAKTPEQAAGFKSWLYEVSKKVAEASKEGGFLGIGGERISEAEEEMLTAVSGALGLAG